MANISDIYELYANQVKRFLIGLTGNVDLAEELTQETFYRAVKSIDTFKENSKMSVWLCQIAKYAYYDYLKKERPFQKLSIESFKERGFDIPSKDELTDTTVMQKETIDQVNLQIQELKEPYREIFLLRTSLQMPFKEIGAIFEKSENWARVSFYRTKVKLSERMKKDEL